jgi:glucose-6-phosphate isomerase
MLLPFTRYISGETGLLDKYDNKVVRRLSDMKGFYADANAERQLIDEADPVVYEMLEVVPAQEQGDLTYCTTVMYPGKVGREFFMTKGHIHVWREAAEIYYFVKGKGVLLSETADGKVLKQEVQSGDIAYVPGGWAHRTVNTGDENLVFLAVYPAVAGHDYDFIAKRGFKVRITDSDDLSKVV